MQATERTIPSNKSSKSRVQHEYGPNDSQYGSTINCDVLVVGAGFCGISAIHRFRQLSLNVKCFESASGFGGVWRWNTYPGARVDSEVPFYQLNIPEVWQEWTFSERFPSGNELLKYFDFVDQKLSLSKDVYFDARVNSCRWNEEELLWEVKTVAGHQARTKFLVNCTGSLHRLFTPDFPGLGSYQGQLIHSGAWDDSFSATGKKVAVIGAGSTAIQITQEIGKVADNTTVFVRRPSYCLPMHQRQVSEKEQYQLTTYYPALFKAGRKSPTGFPSERPPHGLFEAPEEHRLQMFERLWGAGGSVFALNNYGDIIVDKEANKVVYDFWASKVRQRLKDPQKQRIMAPEQPPYWFATKRIPLENDYYEVLNQDNVSVHDLIAAPIKEFVEGGIVTTDAETTSEELHQFDAVVLATGFESFTGSLTRMGLTNRNGVSLSQDWAETGVHTYLGLMVSGYPNMFLGFGPQAPTALSNGPTIIEAQTDIIASILQKMKEDGLTRIEAQPSAEKQWKKTIDGMIAPTLFPLTKSWWNAGNAGRKPATMLYVGGIEMYEKECRERVSTWDGFDVSK